MNRVTNPTEPLAQADCEGGVPCTTCPDKKKCQRGCMRQVEYLSREHSSHPREDMTPEAMKRGGQYNWRSQPERLAYVGSRRYPGDRRTWHQFEKVGKPGVVWCEVLDADLSSFEET